MPTRRDFLIGAAAAGLPSIINSGIAGPASAAVTTNARENNWDQGWVQHLLPTVNHDRLLIKASFDRSLSTAPELQVGTNRVRGQRNTGSEEVLAIRCVWTEAGDNLSAVTHRSPWACPL